MEKGELEEKLKSIVGKPGEQTDLGIKLRNILQIAKEAIEKKEMTSYHLLSIFLFNKMKEEGIIPAEIDKNSGLTTGVYNHFENKYKPNSARGISCKYLFFDNTPLSEYAKKDIAMRREAEAKVQAYVKEHNGKPDPEEFLDFVFSILPDNLGIDEENPYIGHRVTHFHDNMKMKYRVGKIDTEQIEKDIDSELKKLT